LVRPSTFTDVITSSASDMVHLQARCQLCPGTGVNYLVQPHTFGRASDEAPEQLLGGFVVPGVQRARPGGRPLHAEISLQK